MGIVSINKFIYVLIDKSMNVLMFFHKYSIDFIEVIYLSHQPWPRNAWQVLYGLVL